jgi:hypothetical protein
MNYIPDSVYMVCGSETQDCNNVCSNTVFSPVVNGYVHDPYNGKVFCPFGKKNSMNQTIFGDQGFLNYSNIITNNNYTRTTFGQAPQLDPRSLAKIGLEWRTS